MGFQVIANERMAGRLITDLDACHAYLDKLKGACTDASYKTILSQQSSAWQRKLTKVKLSATEAADLVGKVSQGPWNSADRDCMISGINEATMVIGSDGATRCRPKQTMNDIVPYMTQGDLQVLQGRSTTPIKLQVLADRMFKVGLHLPTEPTTGKVLQSLGFLYTWVV